ncbi:hypothetical protein RR48_01183 [Papilio machaon]|uniref:Uncharacterized protein n=1 Tax=Papilio machaon TaxID=76193 RepID=A0A0N1IG47_PAPMA|nr:hypothetical protein RR48_01183 [Papilio machaon]
MTSVVRRREQDDSGEFSDASQDNDRSNSVNVSSMVRQRPARRKDFHVGGKRIATTLSPARSRAGMFISFRFIEVTVWAPLTKLS